MPVISAYIMPHPPIIVPGVGRGQEKAAKKTVGSCHAAAKEIGASAPQTIIVISPHSTCYGDYIHISPGKSAQGSLKRFGAPELYKADYDTELVMEICRLCDSEGFPAGTAKERDASLDHGTLVPLYFINQYCTNYKLVRCSASGLSKRDHCRFGQILSRAAENTGKTAVILASGDLSHKLKEDGPYGFAPEGPKLDAKLTDIMKSAEFEKFLELDSDLCEKGAECGLASFATMAGALAKIPVETRFYSYEGPFGVGYAVCGYKAATPDPYVALARHTIENYVKSGKMPPLPEDLPDDLTERRAGVFVSLKKNKELRGCIGTISPACQSIAGEIMANAICAACRDPRFSPVEPLELPELSYSVDVLSEPEPVFGNDTGMLDVLRYGVIVTSGYKRGLLLPNLEGVDTAEQQIDIARQKAGIKKSESYQLERFEVVRHI